MPLQHAKSIFRKDNVMTSLNKYWSSQAPKQKLVAKNCASTIYSWLEAVLCHTRGLRQVLGDRKDGSRLNQCFAFDHIPSSDTKGGHCFINIIGVIIFHVAMIKTQNDFAYNGFNLVLDLFCQTFITNLISCIFWIKTKIT